MYEYSNENILWRKVALDYELYSTSYFSTSDTPSIKNQKIILNEKDGESCGIFEDEFDKN